jgi:hypothetical protein
VAPQTDVVPSIEPSARVPARRDHPVLRLLLLAACSVAGLALTYVLAVRTRWGQELDQKAVKRHDVLDGEALDLARDVLGTISIGALAIAAGALIFIGLVRRRVLLAMAVGIVILGANVTTQVLKLQLLERPALFPVGNLDNTFPSGHSTVAMSLAVAAVLVAPRRWRGTAALAGVVYAAAVGSAVLVARWHRPSDAVGAAFVAVAWAAGVAAMLVAVSGTGQDLPGYTPLARRPVTWILTAAGALVLVGVALVALTALYHGSVGDLVLVERGRAMVWGLVVIVATDCLMMGLLLVGLRGVSLDPPPLRVDAGFRT